VRGFIWFAALLIVLPFAAQADIGGEKVNPLPCGIYDEQTQPLVQRALETRSGDPSKYTMETTTKSGRRLRVEVVNVSIDLPGERNHVSVFLDNKPLVKTSHQDVPLYLEVHVDETKYRVICVRVHPGDAGEDLMPAAVLSTPPSSPQSLVTTTDRRERGPGIRTAPTASAAVP
jgi:hypothetical protein